MKVFINEVEYEYFDNIVENEKIRNSFMALIKDAFGVDFKDWYKAGFWSSKYEPHVLVKDGEVVATITVNHMKYRYHGEKSYIQLGGVVTRREYRKRNLGRWLMEHIVERYKDQCDQMFLLCNDSAVEFYPKFGFQKAQEHIAEYQWEPQYMPVHNDAIRKLNMDDQEDRGLLLECYRKSNPFSRFPSMECEELLFFYCLGWRKDCMYYFPELGLVAIAKFRKSGLVLEDIYGENKDRDENDMELIKRLLYAILLENKREQESISIRLGFSPVDSLTELTISPLIEKDDTLYLLENKENLFECDRLRFPILSHN